MAGRSVEVARAQSSVLGNWSPACEKGSLALQVDNTGRNRNFVVIFMFKSGIYFCIGDEILENC